MFLRGSKSPEEIWAENQLGLLPSIAEGTSLALLEAMKCGRTALVTNVGDSALWINDERGYVINGMDSKSISTTLFRAIMERESWEIKGKECAKLIESNLNDNQAKVIVDAIVNKGHENLKKPEDYLKEFS